MKSDGLPASLYSPEQLEACAMELDDYLGWRRRQNIRQRTGTKTSASSFEFSPELSDLLGGVTAADNLNISELEGLSSKLQTWLKGAVVHLTFAAMPPPDMKRELVAWFRSHIAPDLLVRFGVNRNIIGGVVVRTTSKIHDYSFRQHFFDHRDLIPELLQNV